MKRFTALAGLVLLSCSALAADKTPFSVQDLVRLERVSDPHLSPDGRYVAYQLRETDMDANKGIDSLWLVDLSGKNSAPRRRRPSATRRACTSASSRKCGSASPSTA